MKNDVTRACMLIEFDKQGRILLSELDHKRGFYRFNRYLSYSEYQEILTDKTLVLRVKNGVERPYAVRPL